MNEASELLKNEPDRTRSNPVPVQAANASCTSAGKSASYLLLFLCIILMTACTSVAGSSGFFTNPVVSGNWPDPGVIKVGDDYYSVCSSTAWQPGTPVIHSRDLIHWRYVGNGYLQHPAIPAGRTNAGCWGLEMGYNPNNGMFIIYAPIKHAGLHAYYSTDPAGPYKVKNMGRLGTDPGFFVDKDGTPYLMCSEKAVIWELTTDGLSIKRNVAKIRKDDIHIFEGPDLLRHGDFYYLLYSANGTGPHQGGLICTMRAPKLEGPWLRDPNNPQLMTFHSDDIQGPQHPTLIKTRKGRWFVLYHAHELSYYTLGRQMYMEPVIWTDDGWWKPVHGRKPTRVNKKPDLPRCRFELAQTDEFSASKTPKGHRKLGLQWFFHCSPDYSGNSWSLSEKPGYLTINTSPGDISSPQSLPNVFLQRVINKKFEFFTRVTFDASQEREAAGLHMYHDPEMNLWLVTSVKNGQKTIEVGKYNKGKRSDLWAVPNNIGNTVHLKIKVNGKETAAFYYSPDGRKWKRIGKEIYFGNSWRDLRNGKKGNPDLGWVGYRYQNKWSAATFGLFAVRNGAEKSKKAYFDYFRVNAGD